MFGIVPKKGTHHHSAKAFIQKKLQKCTHVFVRNDSVRPPHRPPFHGPFKIIERFNKYFKIDINNKSRSVSVDRLKAAILPAEEEKAVPNTNPGDPNSTPIPTVTRSGRRVIIPQRYH